MYNVLIVDDEIHAVRGVISCLDWESLQVTGIFSAYNVNQAKDQFARHPIDIMICDIEMPGGSGLELLNWVVENHPAVVSVFLTCHSEFNYAVKAVQLGVLDYLLKPVRASELEAVVRKAIGKIEQAREQASASSTYKHYFELWSTHQILLVEHFWLDLIDRNIPLNPENLHQALTEFDLLPLEQLRFQPILLVIRHWDIPMEPADIKTQINLIRDLATERFISDNRQGRVIPITNNRLFAVIPRAECKLSDKIKLAAEWQPFIDDCRQKCQCEIACYIGKRSSLAEIPDKLDTLIQQDADNVVWNHKILFEDMPPRNVEPTSLSVPDNWDEMLLDGRKDDLLKDLKLKMETLVTDGNTNASKLREFYHDLMQIIYNVLQKRGVRAHQVFSLEEIKGLERIDIRSVSDLQERATQLINKIVEWLEGYSLAQTQVEQVRRYITEHIAENLSRDDIANHFFLNPDYLTRKFKRVTGLSISDYLIQERIRVAKELLHHSNMPVSEIVSFIGYANLSHFSKMFKKATGFNPLDYRRKKQIKE